ncbi:unnamed protein product [Durusdinium trenchii]|uniref:Uncharacterized protein n=1 Tax=Durusdinium trenchii TaxID=1381693 RepID=A0ABP0SXZ2_9DINO
MEADALGAAADEVDSTSSPSTEELPMPVFLHRHRRGLHRTSRMVSTPLRNAQAESGSPRSWRTASGERSGERGDEGASSGEAMSQESDPWLGGDPWQRGQENYEPKYDNWSSPSSSVSGNGTSRRSSSNDSWQYIQDTSRESRHVYWADGGWSQSQWGASQEDDMGSSWSWSSSESGWSGTGPNQWGWRDDLARNWETDSERSGTSDWSSSSWKTAREDDGRAGGDWGRTSSGLQGGQERGPGVCAGDRAAAGRPTPVGLPAELGEGPQVHHGDPLRSEASSRGEHDKHDGMSPMSPAAQPAGEWNRPSGLVPSGQPSVAGGSGGAVGGSLKEGTTGKISTTYPPIFYARPGESWEQYWRTVTFWLASEGKSLPVEMRGPRLMQQLRERAGKIVQHLTVEEVTSEQGVQLIKQEMEKSPIIRLLDNKKIDKRRQKFMKLTRLANESIESFINRAEIYRRENEASPAYRVGSCFYVGHLLDSAKLTRKDLALLKAACGGDVEDETKVISAMLELAEQFEGAPHCPIGRGEPQLDNEDQYLIQKPGTSSSSTPPTSASEHTPRRRPFSRGRGGGFGRFRRGRIRDALVAILEEEDDGEGVAEELAEALGEDSMDEEEERGEQASDLNEFNDVLVAGPTSETSSTATPLAEIYAQEYKARNRAREIKKMRQYFQKEAPGGPAAARNEHVKKWVAEQQKKEPCFICHQLGHWSQECPYRRKEKPMVHSANVFELSQQEWENVGQDNELEEMSAQEEDTTGVASLRHPMRTVKRQSLNRMLRKPTSTSPPGRKTLSKMTKGRDSKTPEPDQPASSSEAQMSMAQIQAMMVRMQEMMMAQGMPREQEVEADQGHDPGQRHRGRSQEPAKTKDKVKKTPRAVRTAALTGDEAPFPSLSTQFSDDPTMNLMISLRSQTLTFKWKLLLLMLRIKHAVEVDYEAARQPHCKSMGPPGSGKAAVLFPKGGLAGTVMQEETSTAEQEARRMDRLDLVMGTPGYESAMDALHVVPDYEIVNDDGGQSDDEQGASGVQKALQTHSKIFDVLDAKSAQIKVWTLFEVFAGCARFSQRAMHRRNACWDVLPPQDILYGLDLLKEDELEMLKDVIRTQRPDVVTVAPPCGPWSSWQRMRKRKSALRDLRRQHLPFWDFVTWLWEFQCSTGGLVVLEQPASSDALRLPMMTRRRRVHQRVVHMCRLGMRDQVTNKPHKKPTVVQMNHAAITTEMFPQRLCECQPGEHQPIEGSVQALMDENESMRVELHQHTPDTRVWEAVPVEVEPTAEGQLRQQMAVTDGLHRYDYVSFLGASNGLSRKVRSTLAHLHVALGHISNDKLARMMSQNGAKPVVLQAIKDLDCQICKQVVAPHTTPKAAYARPMSFNVRTCADTFYVWDAKATKFAVTHVLDAFSLYQMAIATVDASAQSTVSLLRDGWIRAFGAPNVFMTDQGPEFQGQVESLLRTFSIYHDMVPPSASWRMGLAERHGSVLKLLVMKIIKEKTIIGLEEVQTAVASAVASRNLQARVAGFSPAQLIFGKEMSLPGNLMEAIAGQFKFQVANPQTMDEAIHRASSIRRAATEAYQWLEASDALKKAAGSRARLPRLELLVEGSMVMFYEPPVSRRGLARRLQDQVSWVGPAVVVAVERFDGAIKRVWIRYRHKLRGLPLEHVRLATGDEIESTKVTKEALQDLMKKLQSGRVNADIAPEDEPVHLPTPADPDPRYPPMEFSDDEQPAEDKPVRVEDLHRATSVLDDIPISVAQKIKQKADQGQADRSTRRKLDAEASSIRATVASSSAVDPALTSVRQKRDFYETAFKSTQEHLKKMKTKLEKKEAMVVVPVRDCELVEEGGESEVPNSADPCYSPFSEDTNETSPSMDSPFIEVDMFAVPNVYDDQGNPHEVSHDMYVVDMLRECPPINVDYDVLEADWRPDGERRIGIRRRNPTPCIRAKVPVAKWRTLGDVPGRLRRPLTRTEIIEVYKKAPGRAQVLDELSDYMEANLPGEMLLRLSGESDYWLHAPSQRELWRVHLQPRQYLFVPGVVPDEEHPQDAQGIPSEVPGLQGLRATQVGYLSPQASKEYLVDNINWKGWNASVHLNQLSRGVTRFVTMDPVKDHPILATWNQGRAAAEDLWRRHLKANAAYQVLVAEGQAADFIAPADGLHADQSHRLEVALDVLECLLKRVVRSSLAAEVSQAAVAMEEADFLRALMAEALEKNFSLKNWLQSVARWRQVAVMDSKTGYDLLNGTSLGEDKRLAIDVASMRQALHEDGGSRMVRWVPGEEILADDLTKLVGNQKLVTAMEDGMWALKDTEEAKRLRADAAVRKRTYRYDTAIDMWSFGCILAEWEPWPREAVAFIWEGDNAHGDSSLTQTLFELSSGYFIDVVESLTTWMCGKQSYWTEEDLLRRLGKERDERSPLWDPMGDQRLYDKLLQSVTCFEDSARLGHPAVYKSYAATECGPTPVAGKRRSISWANVA